jgi:hypothetical protein
MPPALTWSIVVACVAVFAFGFWVSSDTGQKRFPRLHGFSLVMQLAAAIVGYMALRPGGHDDKQSIAAAQAAGSPVLVSLHSNF